MEGATGVDQDRIRKAVVEIIAAIGEDPNREGLRDTPRRVAQMYAEAFSGLHTDPRETLRTTFSEPGEEMIVVRDIPFSSLCEHHFLPFLGHAHIGYIPRGRVVGLSKLARAVEAVAHRPQLQERMTGQIADAVMLALKPLGAAVILEAEHLCMTIRGVKKPGSVTVTSAMRGVFRSSAVTREEFLQSVWSSRRP
ncbi:MAG: GTP cyclohydrolase I FolE [Chloroflexi bacterium]|nr:GTP cyclohydrolase I FolE [Chloroflexota bacterium]